MFGNDLNCRWRMWRAQEVDSFVDMQDWNNRWCIHWIRSALDSHQAVAKASGGFCANEDLSMSFTPLYLMQLTHRHSYASDLLRALERIHQDSPWVLAKVEEAEVEGEV